MLGWRSFGGESLSYAEGGVAQPLALGFCACIRFSELKERQMLEFTNNGTQQGLMKLT